MVQGELSEQCQSQPGGAALAPKVTILAHFNDAKCKRRIVVVMSAFSPLIAAGLEPKGEGDA